MLHKTCDTCNGSMLDLNTGWELEFRQGIRRLHFCSWDCVRGFDVEAHGVGNPIKVWKLGVDSSGSGGWTKVDNTIKPWMHRQSQVDPPTLVQAAIDKALLKNVSDADEDTDLKRIVDDARLDKTVYTDEIDNV